MIKEFLQSFGDIKIADVKKIGKQYYQISPELQKEVDSLDEFPISAGLLLGEVEKGQFIPSPNLLNIINEQTKKKIILNEKSSWLFVCGRDIFMEGVIDNCFEKGPILVLNEQQEVLGVAEKKGKEYKNIYDIGLLLRREQKKRR
ncbi:MAG: hypothetical protein KC535_01470 [Nanoarchaeota archaeon]|nr:hypothetical protein [Nanoarchaeota archaeon]